MVPQVSSTPGSITLVMKTPFVYKLCKMQIPCCRCVPQLNKNSGYECWAEDDAHRLRVSAEERERGCGLLAAPAGESPALPPADSAVV